ncbi:glutamate [NMDA] receptor subunit 1-like isoform X2 [Portunus trituberculatus]|uniref:glutamate [NMDA] receptor subunit 1-like isoform X2 n=1 Tax=Portunus trituberculatus TaxID=210409 RepID=UPI001E1CBEE5|nr:glutamate [NMDA] receptor subunit 1-like isoform X2 [Portunus trituberculatus]
MPRWCDRWWWVVWVASVAAGAESGGGAQGSLPPSRRFNIGGVLHDNDTELHFTNALKKINFDGISVADQTTLYDVTLVHRGNPIAAALHVCQTVIAQAVFAVVVASSSYDSVTTASVSYTCGFYHIPVICTHSRDYIFSDKNIHVSLLRTVPPYSHQADVWVRLLKLLGYRQVIVLHSADTDGRALLARFQSAARHSDNEKGVKVVTVMEFAPGQESFVRELTTIREELVKVVLVHASEEDAEIIFHDASYLNMTNENYVWLVTEQALHARFVPAGALGLQLKYADDYNAHITDSLRVVALALRRLHEAHEVIPKPPISCDDWNGWDETGRELFSLIRGQVLTDGQTGKVAFDEHGDRTHAEYSVVNVQERRPLQQDYPVYRMPEVVGEFLYDVASDEMVMQLNKSSIRWAGGLTEAPPGYFLPKHLKVLTIRETPFVYAEAVKDEAQCSLQDEVFCPMLTGKEGETLPMCCWGFCIDLLLTLAEKNAFSFSLFLAPDGQYGDLVEGPDGRNWTGMIGHLAGDGDADMAVAPLTINPQRSQDIHLTKPFKYQGITILVKRASIVPALVSILQPFRGTLWLLLMATVHVIAVLIWLLDRLSPVYSEDKEEDGSESMAISESFWFSWSVILNSGLSEGTPRGLSGRVLGIIWSGFTMIMVASYTANLAAFLVLDTPETPISGINDPRLRNPVENFSFATVRGSAVDMFFRRKTEWANMYRVMEAHDYRTVDEAVQAVRDGRLQAFIWESSRLEYEASMDCNLVTVGELFGRSGYGIGLKKESPWSEKITLDILDLHERGYMEDLDKKWIWNEGESCNVSDQEFSKRLGLKNLEGIFILVAGGVLSGIPLIVMELIYYRCKRRYEAAKSDGSSQQHQRGSNSQGDDNLRNPLLTKKTTAVENNLAAKPHSSPGRGATLANYVADGSIERHRYPHLHAHLGNSEEVLQEVEERLLASPHIPEEWWILAPPTCPHYRDGPELCHAPCPTPCPAACPAPCPADYDGPVCLDPRCAENPADSGTEDCTQFHVDVDLHVAEAGVEEAGEACVFGGCECNSSGTATETPAAAEGSNMSRPPHKVPLENLPDVVDNCSEREECVDGVVRVEGVEGGEVPAGGAGGSRGGLDDQRVNGGPKRKRRTIYV